MATIPTRSMRRWCRRGLTRAALICCKTVIGRGAPNKAGSHDVHDAPLGAAEVAAAREAIGWTHAPFEIPAAVYEHFGARARGTEREVEWNQRLERYAAAYLELAAELLRRLHANCRLIGPTAAGIFVEAVAVKGETIASRKASQNAIEALGSLLPELSELLRGSAELTGSNLTNWSGSRSMTPAASSNTACGNLTWPRS